MRWPNAVLFACGTLLGVLLVAPIVVLNGWWPLADAATFVAFALLAAVLGGALSALYERWAAAFAEPGA